MAKNNTFGRRMIWKGVFILLAVLILQIPILLIRSLIDEREKLSLEVQNEVNQQEGGAQYVYAPELKLPYNQKEVDSKAKTSYSTKLRTIESVEAHINGDVNVHMLHRSIYDIPTYKADLTIDGHFNISEEDLEYYNGTVYLYLPVGHFKGLENITAKVDGKDYIFELSENGIRIELDMANLQAGQIINYSVSYTTSGAQYLKFNPNSGTFKVNLSSKYTSPSFNGTFLPNERTIDDNGFKAEWTVTKFNTYGIDYKTFYVEFIVPVTQYQQATRATKYSFLIILLVFTAIFLVEVISRQEVNYIQYIVTGF